MNRRLLVVVARLADWSAYDRVARLPGALAPVAPPWVAAAMRAKPRPP